MSKNVHGCLSKNSMSDLKKIQIARSMRKTLSLQILPDTTLLVKAPLYVSDGDITSFVLKHKEWIDRKRLAMEEKKVVKKQYVEGEEFYYLGKSYILKVGNYTEIKVEGDFLLFPNFLVFRAEKELTSWYISQAKKIIQQQLENYAKQMNMTYQSVTFSDTKSKWGSCTHDNRLQFCWRLIMAPLLTINYVVVHELTHTVEKNHGRSFWSKVRLYNPSYRQQVKWLKLYGNTLIF